MRSPTRATAAVLGFLAGAASAQTPSLGIPATCEASVTPLVDQPRWWDAASRWSELTPPQPLHANWSPLQFASMPDGTSYYLLALPSPEKCYVAVCAGPGNVCRLFELPAPK